MVSVRQLKKLMPQKRRSRFMKTETGCIIELARVRWGEKGRKVSTLAAKRFKKVRDYRSTLASFCLL